MKKYIAIADVSIISANYNNAIFLSDYFNSIKLSTLQPKEIIFVDDASTDESLKIIEDIPFLPNLVLICNKQNIGFAESLNVAIEKASAKYIMRLDPDDFIAPIRIEKQFLQLENEVTIDIIGSNVFYFNQSLQKVIQKSDFPLSHQRIRQTYLNGGHGLIHSAVMARNDVFKKNKYIQEYVPAEEYEFFTRCILAGYRMANLQEALTYYRIHSKNVSGTKLAESLKKISDIRHDRFGIKSSGIQNTLRKNHLKFYRQALLAEYRVKRIFWYGVSILFSPFKIFKRISKLS